MTDWYVDRITELATQLVGEGLDDRIAHLAARNVCLEIELQHVRTLAFEGWTRAVELELVVQHRRGRPGADGQVA